MAKFYYRMQNVLDIKSKLEESAKQEYAEARRVLNQEEEKLVGLKEKKDTYIKDYNEAIVGKLDFLEIESNSKAIDIMEDIILKQNEIVKKRSRDVEKAREKLNKLMQERKMHEKLKEKKFEEFIEEEKASENKETDGIVSYLYNNKER